MAPALQGSPNHICTFLLPYWLLMVSCCNTRILRPPRLLPPPLFICWCDIYPAHHPHLTFLPTFLFYKRYKVLSWGGGKRGLLLDQLSKGQRSQLPTSNFPCVGKLSIMNSTLLLLKGAFFMDLELSCHS